MKGQFEIRRKMSDPLLALPHDIGFEIASALRDAVDLEFPAVFIDVVTWAQTSLLFRDVPPSTLIELLDNIHAHLGSYVPPTQFDAAREVLTQAKALLEVVRLADKPFVDDSTPERAVGKLYLEAVLEGDERRATRELLMAYANGMRVVDIYEHILTPVLQETGRLWQRNEIGVSQEHVITAAVERVMAQLIDVSPPLTHRDLSVVTAAVEKNQHQIGARMVADAFSLYGWNATYLGSTVPVDDLLEYVDRISVDVLALSAALSRDVVPLRRLIRELSSRPVAPIVLVGGRPFAMHESLWRHIGADGYAASPLAAVALANELVCHNCAE
jgi:methanogenic corrinoid protein MtbC1